jgi:hypothetical protein
LQAITFIAVHQNELNQFAEAIRFSQPRTAQFYKITSKAQASEIAVDNLQSLRATFTHKDLQIVT